MIIILLYYVLFSIRWVREFLDDRNRGLDALVDYLGFRLGMMRHERRPQQGDSRTASEERLAAGVIK